MKIKVHADLRRFVTNETRIESLKCYHERFKGVFTDFISLKVSRKPTFGTQNYLVYGANNEVSRKEFKPLDDDFCAIPMLNDRDEAILAKVERLRHDDLSHSQWALGIITGNNDKVLKDRPRKGLEPIFTGKDISKYGLKKAAATSNTTAPASSNVPRTNTIVPRRSWCISSCRAICVSPTTTSNASSSTAPTSSSPILMV